MRKYCPKKYGERPPRASRNPARIARMAATEGCTSKPKVNGPLTRPTPYGATTIAGPKGELAPAAGDLDICRAQGKRVAELAKKSVLKR
jgi:hypothetical protein